MKAFDAAQGDHVTRLDAPGGVPGEITSVRIELGRRVAAWRATGNPPLMQHSFAMATAWELSLSTDIRCARAKVWLPCLRTNT